MGIIDGDTKEENPPRNDSGAGFQILPTRHLASLKSVQLLWQKLAANALVVALNRCSFLALTLRSRLLVELACAQFGQQTGFFDAALEATQGDLEGLVFFKANNGHEKSVMVGQRRAREYISEVSQTEVGQASKSVCGEK